MGRARYDDVAEWYDAEFATTKLGLSAREGVLRMLGDGPGLLLDVGCGGGAHAVAFAERGWTVTGVDHPCFVGPHAFVHDRDVPELSPGYRDTSYWTEAPGIWREGIRSKVGATHLPLGLFLQTFLDAGLILERVEEPVGRDYPHIVALRARR
jgi:hypothetical protein